VENQARLVMEDVVEEFSLISNVQVRYTFYFGLAQWLVATGRWPPVFRIRIHVFFGLPDPDPLVRGMDPDPALDKDPDPSIIMQK
jgi:hypothetical protein